MTTSSQTPRPEGRNEPGYRGSLPERQDRLARPWILAVIAIFVLIIVLSIAGIPSRFVPEPTSPPLRTTPASGSVEPSASASGSGGSSPSTAASGSASESASASPAGG